MEKKKEKIKKEENEVKEEKENKDEESIDFDKLAIAPIAEPMASDKLREKLLKLTSKLSKYKLIKRGVKEVNKFFRRGEFTKNESICILAGDISPIDVICHIPILCEKNGVPYVYIPSRQLLGTASQTKRPTSVVLLIEPPEENEYADKFTKIHSVVQKYNLSD